IALHAAAGFHDVFAVPGEDAGNLAAETGLGGATRRHGAAQHASGLHQFLEYVRAKYEGQYWHATARELTGYVRAKIQNVRSPRYVSAAKGSPQQAKVWIDLDNTPHVPFFEPIIKELRERGYDVLCTARDAFQVCDLARQRGISFHQVGRHSGKNRLRKVAGLFARALQL